jgi:hypothetical protein
MNPAKTLGVYALASMLVTVIARPGYDAFGAIIILVAGAAGSLKLCIESTQDVFYEDLALGRQFSSEALTVSLLALVIWILGAFFLFRLAKASWKGGFIAAAILLWIAASSYNIFWFGIRSL